MKVFLYTEMEHKLSKSGLGKAIRHQIQALEDNNIPYTLKPTDDYDILHLNFYGPESYSLAKKAKKEGKKIVYHAHSTEEDFRNSFLFSNLAAPMFKKWLIRCYSLGDCIITPTPYSKRLLEGYGIDVPIYAISNGIDTQSFMPNKENGKLFRKKYGYTDEQRVIMAVGLYIQRKGILDFVELAKRLPEYEFIWFGYSPPAASPKVIRDALKTPLPNLKFPGYVEPKYLKYAYSGADLLLVPTYEETEGIPVLEGCCEQIELLIRDIPVFEGWMKDGENCHMAKSVDEFEEKIKGVFNGTLPSLAGKGLEVALERDIKRVGQQLAEVYRSLM
jgi:1,2-diacylglycerol-3-alpha-glucose alpha-1,2-glucosyltransferase